MVRISDTLFKRVFCLLINSSQVLANEAKDKNKIIDCWPF